MFKIGDYVFDKNTHDRVQIVDVSTVWGFVSYKTFNPVTDDVTGMIGKLSTMQDSFSLACLKEKIFEEWGERTTLFHLLDKIMQTMRQIGAGESKCGVYTVCHYEIKNNATKKIILKTILALKKQVYYEPSELEKVPQMFPFEDFVETDLIFGTQAVKRGNFGGSLVVFG